MRLKKKSVKRSTSAELLAREYAFLLLKFRLRSEQEIAQRLRQKKFSPEVISGTVNFLKEKDFLNDATFCRLWLASRVKRSLGPRRIIQELKQKGISKELIDETLAGLRADYSEGEKVLELAQDRLAKLKSLEPLVARRRTFAYLIRRGFSPEIVQDTISALCKQRS
jgi:regulatory protein